MSDIRQGFREIWEVDDAHPFQERVADRLLAGRNVILQAPTGSGKTMAALYPFLHARDRDIAFPRKCLYAVPMRVLANQFIQEHEEPGRGIRAAIQTGDQPRDPRFESELVFATIDQVLSSFLHVPYSLSRRLANFNAGAVVASYLVFDEFHLFDPESTLPTALEMLRMCRGITPFLLMTATFSSRMLDGLARWLDAEVIPGTGFERDEMLNLPAERSKQRFYQWNEQQLTAETILDRHQRRSLVVCNVVDRAQALYRQLKCDPRGGDIDVILLHSRFLPEDRAIHERNLCTAFGKGADREAGSVIAVATQVIEVGLDISAEILHTEWAPANAILQRAGRCARFQKETGSVYVYPAENKLPYQGQERIIDLTIEWLKEHSGERLDFAKEQQWVDFAHGEHDEQMLRNLRAVRSNHRLRMEKALDGDFREAGELIRKITSQSLTISSDPDRLLDRPFEAPLFSLHPGTVKKTARTWMEQAAGGVKRLEEVIDDPQGYAFGYRWVSVSDETEVRGAPLLAVPPGVATYDPEEGLILDRGGDFTAEKWLADHPQDAGSEPGQRATRYELEAYTDHVRLVYEAFEQVWTELAPCATRLEERAGWPAGCVTRAAALVVLLHDLGKLTVRNGRGPGWQNWVREWQEKIGQPVSADTLAAHTDYDDQRALHRQLASAMRRRPPHAMESAVSAAPLLAGALEAQPELAKAAFSAIARHHGAFVDDYTSYELAEGAGRDVMQTLQWVQPHTEGLDQFQLLHRGDHLSMPVHDFLVDVSNERELLAYMLLVRSLRRADQLGTSKGAHR